MKKILVAEGSPTIKSVADSVLRQNGYDVVCTSDGLQAWEVISTEKPDLVLSGIGLSGISGLELCRQVSKDQTTGGVPTIVLVGPKDPVTDEEILASGARGKLKKPFSPRELLDVVGRITGTQISSYSTGESASGSSSTKFNPQISSAQGVKEKSDSLKLDWLDLNDGTPTIRKVVSLDVGSEEQKLIIEEDQYGLAKQHDSSGPDNMPKDKDDYEWFIGEMQREIENKRGPQQSHETAKAGNEPRNQAESPTGVKFDDIKSAKDDSKPGDEMFAAKSPSSLVTEIDGHSNIQPRTLDEEDIARLVDRVMDLLAARIIASIDKNEITAIVKAALK